MISIDNLTISTKAPVGTTVGTLSLMNASAVGMPSTFILTKNSAGYFDVSGHKLQTLRTSITPGYYSVRVRGTSTSNPWSDNATFLVTVTP